MIGYQLNSSVDYHTLLLKHITNCHVAVLPNRANEQLVGDRFVLERDQNVLLKHTSQLHLKNMNNILLMTSLLPKNFEPTTL